MMRVHPRGSRSRRFFWVFLAALALPAGEAPAFPYNAAQVEVPDNTVPTTTADLGLDQGDVGWGDFDSDGDLDALTNGRDTAGTPQLRVYRNDGAVFNVIEVDGAGGGLRQGSVAWGDFDNDRDLDILASGRDAGNVRRLRIYLNNGDGTIDPTQIDIAGGLSDGDVSWGDFDNDGDLDVLANGASGGGGAVQARVYRNLGNGSIDPTPLEVDALNGGLDVGGQVFGDIDNDGDLDVVIMGLDGGNVQQLRAYVNNGNGTFNATQIEVPGAPDNGLEQGNVALADFDNDGDLDILASGRDNANNERILVYGNNNPAAANPFLGGGNPIDVDPNVNNDGGLRLGRVAWGDSDNDGDLDILVSGIDANGDRQIWVYSNNGNGTFNAAQTVVEPVPPPAANQGGLSDGGVAWGDMDGDNKLDILVSGRDRTGAPNRQLRIYRNTTAVANAAPTPPATLVSTFTFVVSGPSTATFKWNPGADGANSINSLYYDIDISSISVAFTGRAVFPGTQGGSPRLGAYNRPPRVFDGNANHGMLLVSTYSYAPQTGAPYGLRTDTTYYYRVRTVDAGLRLSGWSGTGSLWTGVAPAASAIAAAAPVPGEATVSWLSAGDDLSTGTLTGLYRLQYSTNPAAAWSEMAPLSDGVTVTVSTSNQAPNVAVSTTVYGFQEGFTYYFRLWTQDDVGLWSPISNQASAFINIGTRSLSLSTNTHDFGTVPLGASALSAAGVTVTYTGDSKSTFLLSASTITAGSPWTLGAAPGADALRLYAGFASAAPLSGDFGAEDVLFDSAQPCSSAAHALSLDCAIVSSGDALPLWFRLDMPTSSSEPTAMEQQVQVTITAGPP